MIQASYTRIEQSIRTAVQRHLSSLMQFKTSLTVLIYLIMYLLDFSVTFFIVLHRSYSYSYSYCS